MKTSKQTTEVDWNGKGMITATPVGPCAAPEDSMYFNRASLMAWAARPSFDQSIHL